MDIVQQVGQCFMVGFEGTTAPEYLLEWLRAGRVGGIILFSRNVESPAQLAALTRSLHAAAAYPILVSIDQEGGTVTRLRDLFTEAPGAMAISNTDDPQSAFIAYQTLGQEMRELGINWDYAPVVDLAYNRENPTVGTRSYGSSAARVGRFARAAVRGLQSVRVAACAKHFPGLGNTTIDTHLALPTLDTPLEHLLANDVHPYREVIAEGVDSIMTTHTRFTTLDATHPATLSANVIKRLLREELGYEGVVTTDCMEMRGITNHYQPGESAMLALLGDVDIVLFSHTRATQEAAMQAVIDAVKGGKIPLSRIEAANQRRARLVEKVAIDTIDPTNVNAPERRAAMQALASRGLSLLSGALPEMEFDHQVAFIEFASSLESEVMEAGGHTGIQRQLEALGMRPSYVALRSYGRDPHVEQALELARQARITIIATRNAYLVPEQTERARQIAATGNVVVHLCLRNPYDAGLFDAATVLASCGDSQPQIAALLEALKGNIDVQPGLRFETE